MGTIVYVWKSNIGQPLFEVAAQQSTAGGIKMAVYSDFREFRGYCYRRKTVFSFLLLYAKKCTKFRMRRHKRSGI